MGGIQPLSDGVAIDQAAAVTGAGTSEIDGASLDMQGFEGCLFIAKFGTAASDNTIQGQQDIATGGSFSDLEGTLVSVGSSDEIVCLDIVKPTKRWVRMQAERGTSTTLDWALAIRYGAHKTPVVNAVAGTLALETHVSPDEGTP